MRKISAYIFILIASAVFTFSAPEAFSQGGELNQCKMSGAGKYWSIENGANHRMKVTYSINARNGTYSSLKAQEVRAGEVWQLPFDVSTYVVTILKIEVAE